MHPGFRANVNTDSACGDLDRPKPKAPLRKCLGADCVALVAPPRKYCAPCSDVKRQAQVNAKRRRARDKARSIS